MQNAMSKPAVQGRDSIEENPRAPLPAGPRPGRRLFVDLAVWMIGFGFLAGVSFPPFVVMLGVPTELAFTPAFYAATLFAGLLVGGVNYALVRRIVRPRLQVLATQMQRVAGSLDQAAYANDWTHCGPDDCRVPVDSSDELGSSARAFNQLIEALVRAHRVEDAVRRFSKTLSMQLDLGPLSRQALGLLLEHTGAMGGAVLVEQEGKLEPVAQHGLDEAAQLPRSDHVRAAMQTLQVQHLELPADVCLEGVVTSMRPREVLVLPVEYKQLALGVVVLASPGRFSEEVRRLLELLRQSFGLALHNALSHARLGRIAALDPLTGCYNRRFGMTRLHEEFARARRSTAPLGVLLFDLDHFKAVNDTYGHLVGDEVLVRTTDAAERVLRDGDVLVRYGGEEFLIVLPGAGLADSHEIAERLRRAVADTEVLDKDQVIRVTLSVGVAAFPETSVETPDQLLQLADEALYRAKDAGRNTVMLARP